MTTEQKLIKNKLGLLELASYLQNVSEACRVMGYSRDTFYRVQKAYEERGPRSPEGKESQSSQYPKPCTGRDLGGCSGSGSGRSFVGAKASQ